MNLYRPDPRTLLLLSALYVALCWATGCADTRSIVSSWWTQQSATEEATESPVPEGPGDSTSLPSENPSGATDAGDALAMSEITWDEPASPAAWPITAKLGAVKITSDGWIAESLTGTDAWPVRDDGGEKPSIGNWSLIRRCSDGKWHGGVVDWFGRDNGTAKLRVSGKKWQQGQDGIHGCGGTEPMPASGEQVYVMASGCIRGGQGCGKERSQTVGVLWP